MKILSRYALDSFLTAFLMSFVVVSAVLTIGLLTPVSGFLLKGVGTPYLLRIAAIGFHEELQLTLPLALFVASVFTFARLKGDGELDAMRTCGVSLVRVAAGPLTLAAVLSIANLWLNSELVPREHELRRRLKAELLLTSGFKLVGPHEVVKDIPGMRLTFDGQEGETMLGLTAHDFGDPAVTRLLTAGKTRMSLERDRIYLDLEDMAIEPLDADKKFRMRATRFHYLLKNAFSAFRYSRRDKDMTNAELLSRSREYESEVLRRAFPWAATSARIELGRRIVYSLAPFCFVLLGIGLGAGARRGDMVRAGFLALGFAIGFYLLVLFVTAQETRPALHPEWLLVLPPLVTLVFGIRRIRRAL